MGSKECFVPGCSNNSSNNQDLLFVPIPERLREEWCRQVNAEYFKIYLQYCCEDHLNVPIEHVVGMGFSTYKYTPVLALQFALLAIYQYHVFYHAGIKTVVKGLESIHLMIFFGFAYQLTFLKKYCYSALGFSLFLGAVIYQWLLVCQLIINKPPDTIYFYIDKRNILEADMMVATVLVTFGVLLGLASGPELLLVSFIGATLAVCNTWIVIRYFQAVDVGRSMCIHLFGAYFGLAVSFSLRPGASPMDLNEPSYHSDSTATLGSLILWVYLPSFNSALTISDNEYQRAVITTYLALAASTVTTFTVSPIMSNGKFDMTYVQTSTLSGGVAVGSVCNMLIGPGEAIAIGMASGFLSVIGNRFIAAALEKINIQDTCGVHNVHAMPALLSGLLSILFADLASKETYKTELATVFPAMDGETGISAGTQALHQLYALLATLAISIVGGLMTGMFVRFARFRPLTEEELYNDDPNWRIGSSTNYALSLF